MTPEPSSTNVANYADSNASVVVVLVCSRQYAESAAEITRLHAEVAHLRRHTIHVFTTNLAKTHGVIVVEGLDAASLLQQKGIAGARSRRRGLSDAALGEIRRQLRYK